MAHRETHNQIDESTASWLIAEWAVGGGWAYGIPCLLTIQKSTNRGHIEGQFTDASVASTEEWAHGEFRQREMSAQ